MKNVTEKSESLDITLDGDSLDDLANELVNSRFTRLNFAASTEFFADSVPNLHLTCGFPSDIR